MNFYCKVNYIPKIFLFKGRQNGTSRSLCRNMRTVLHIYCKLTDSSVYNRSNSLPLLILTKWYYEQKLKPRNLNHYNYFICTSCHTFCYNSILPYGRKCGLQKQSKHRQKESNNNLPDIFVLHMTAILLFNLPFSDLTCYLSFSIGSIVFIFLIQAVIAYFTMFKSLNAIRVQKSANQLFFRWFQHHSTVSFLVWLLHS